MNEKILNEFVAEMTSLLQSGSQFVGEQTPEVIKEVLRFNLFSSIFWAVILGLGTYCLCPIYKHVYPKLCKINDDVDRPMAKVLFWAVMIVVGAIMLPACLLELENAVQILVAPRMYLLEYFARLV